MTTMGQNQNAYKIGNLNEMNYFIWSIEFEMILIRNDLLFIIDGTKSSPSAQVMQLHKRHGKFGTTKFDWILCLTYEISKVKAMHPHKIAKAMWDVIKTMYENVDKTFVVVLRIKFFLSEKQRKMKLSHLFYQILKLQNQLTKARGCLLR